ncbi:mannitol 2-dehydrogenase [Algoriphagus ratkowskyi]|uniref:Mannitol 2-dehydrogenase n=1 Tax=Algoriphagus ratkowskyi TaxID=57028 RepID=A0A2W7QQ23_9BACT|nr:mannitol dehydrogenase family protein [Algoriphagus ratkowskyi]PZX50444.1 mannitol 2-dehydrogenase [Algoriphagus ratkowskyi]TXD75743.1 mannitol dehydrogenase family protein [Algoriphagus ratkowskyi]
MESKNNKQTQNDSSTSILHIGVGNFHRAHQAFYTQLLLENGGSPNWAICGVGMLPSDEVLFEKLHAQQLQYTLTVCGRNGVNETHTINSIKELILAFKHPELVLNKIADASTKIISLTITEGGYNLDKTTNEFILDNPQIVYDLENPSTPKTVFGFIAEGLRRRRANGAGGISILSCDNLQHNGNTAKAAFMAFIAAQDKELSTWVEVNVTFPNSMVDRITPATTPEDVERLNKSSAFHDEAPVYCEDFIQWVIEDDFIAGRPDWETVGVQFTDDVTAYENMKLSLLNASHTLLSYPSFLIGYRKVDEAMADEDIVSFVREFMDIDITPNVPAPEGIDLEEYKQTLVERFANKAVSDQLSRLCYDGISKFPVYIMPNLAKMISNQQDLSRVAFLFANYRHYLKYQKDDKKIEFDYAEPWLTAADKELIASKDPLSFLGLSAFKSVPLIDHNEFTTSYQKYVDSIQNDGTRIALKAILSKP